MVYIAKVGFCAFVDLNVLVLMAGQEWTSSHLLVIWHWRQRCVYANGAGGGAMHGLQPLSTVECSRSKKPAYFVCHALTINAADRFGRVRASLDRARLWSDEAAAEDLNEELASILSVNPQPLPISRIIHQVPTISLLCRNGPDRPTLAHYSIWG
jgi:hypothetical protein